MISDDIGVSFSVEIYSQGVCLCYNFNYYYYVPLLVDTIVNFFISATDITLFGFKAVFIGKFVTFSGCLAISDVLSVI